MTLLPFDDRCDLTRICKTGNNPCMRYKSLALATIFLVASAYAKEPRAYQSGKVLQMDSARCAIKGKEVKSSSSETAGIDSALTQGDTKTQKVVCQD